MNKYFFDIVTARGTQLDFHGHTLAQPDDALHLAEVMALDIETGDHEWEDTKVVVSDVAGGCLYSVGVRHPDIIMW